MMSSGKYSYHELEQRVRELEAQLNQSTQDAQDQLTRTSCLESVFHNGPVAIITLDCEHRIVDWNPGAQDVFGYSKDEASGADLDELVGGPGVDHEARDNTARILEGQILHPVQAIRYAKDGTQVHVLATAVPIFIEGGLKGLVAMYADISQRRQAEIHLKRTLEATNDGIWDYNLVTDEFQYSNRWAEMLGYSQGDVSHLGCFCEDNTHPDDVDRFRKAFADYVEGRAESYELDFRLKTKSGDYKWIYSRGKAVEWDDEGRPVRVVGAHTDISEKKHAEELLLANREKYRALYENAPLSYQSLDAQGNFLDINPTWLNTLGYTRDEVIGKSFETFLHPEWRSHFKLNFPEFKRRGSVKGIQYKILHKKGHYLDVSFEGSLGRSPDGSFRQTYCVFKDITEQERTKGALQESEKKYRSLFEESNDAIFIHTLDGCVLDVNAKAEKLLGFTKAKLCSMKVQDLHPKDTLNESREAIAMTKQRGSACFESRFRRADGALLNVEISSRVVDPSQGLVQGIVRDITERKRFEEALAESEAKFRGMFDNVRDAVFMHKVLEDGSPGPFREFNQAALDRLGYTREELQARDPLSLDDPEVIRNLVPRVMAELREKGHSLFESVQIAKDGRRIPVENHTRLVDTGESPLLITVCRDVSERKEAEKSQALNLARLARAEELAGLGNWELNLKSGRVVWSDQMFRIYGVKPDEDNLRDKDSFLFFVHSEDRERIGTILNRLMDDAEDRETEFRIQLLNGSVKWLKTRFRLIHDEHGQQDRIVGADLDITAQKRSEQELRANEQLLAKTQEIAHLGSWDFDHETRELFWSDEVYRIFGVAPQQFSPTYRVFLELVHPADKARVHDFFRFSTSPQRDKDELEHRIIRRDNGEIRYLLERREHFRNDEGLVVRSIGMVHDITEWRLAQDRLQKMKGRAEAANRAKSEFLANMSHEIRTPLNGIMGMLQVMQTTRLDKEQQEYVEMATKASKRLSRLLSDILDLSRIEADKLEIREEEFLLPEVMESIKDIFTHLVNENELCISFDHELSEPIIGDSTRLTQVLFNLTGNAVKYTVAGKIDVQATLLPSGRGDLCRILFTVSDSGPGIPDDKLETVFDTFSQASDASSPYARHYEGAGLGLPLVKRLVNLMGGNVSIDSGEGQWTTVYVSLPFCVPEHVRHEPFCLCGEDPQRDSSASKILLVDDDAATQLQVSRVLEKHGQVVRVVENGEQALNVLAREGFDCVLMDVQMPVLDGVEATKRIRISKADYKDIPIIALTAFAMTGDRETFHQAGMDDYIAKPVDMDELMRTLRNNLLE